MGRGGRLKNQITRINNDTMPDRNLDTESLVLAIEIIVPLHPLFFLLFLYLKTKKIYLASLSFGHFFLRAAPAVLTSVHAVRDPAG
jgi:hypothetical protein